MNVKTNVKSKTLALMGVLMGVLMGALLILATAAPAGAARPPAVDLRGDGLGSYTLDDAGTALLSGTVTGRPFDGAYTAELASSDGSLPAPGTCEPATATLRVTARRHRYLDLVATGEVCGMWTDATYVVTHSFTGRYVVTGASARRLRCSDGWMSVVLTTDGQANVEAIDT
ncbi:hypothetical protein [Nocardioides sp.]|uniref:hypothetical protein n=1 Tax=Nocardioides sp. TaxID=35761 RepID=UPI001A2F3BF0|nr:hypothetical protein [Nocardioides sp.]MBJ7358190.1 hypothetical protein [Nocardioides sp.]